MRQAIIWTNDGIIYCRICKSQGFHYSDVIMGAMASQITSPHHCLLNRLFRRRSKKTSKLRVTGLCGEFTGDRWTGLITSIPPLVHVMPCRRTVHKLPPGPILAQITNWMNIHKLQSFPPSKSNNTKSFIYPDNDGENLWLLIFYSSLYKTQTHIWLRRVDSYVNMMTSSNRNIFRVTGP